MKEDCKGCPLLNEKLRHPFMESHGPINARIALVGEAPGKEEDEQGIQFVGETGQLLRREWKSILGFDLEEVFIQNVVRCRPPDNRTPKRAEVKRCLPELEAELEKGEPELLVVVGNPAMHGFDIKGKITEKSGKVFEVKDKPYKNIIPLIHPSYVKRNPKEIALFRRSLEAIKNFLEHGHQLDLGEYIKVTDDNVEEFFQKLDSAKHFVVDIETNGLNPFMEGAQIKCISFCFDPRIAYVLPITENGKLLWDDEIWTGFKARIKLVLEDPTVKKSGANLQFERAWFKVVWGMNLKGIEWDTQVAAFEMDKLRSCGLKEQAWSIGLGGYERMLSDRVDLCEGDVLFEYCSIDADAEHRLRLKQQEEMAKKPKLQRYYRKLAIPLLSEFSELHLRGLRVDMERLEYLEKLGQEFVRDLRKRVLSNKWVRKASRTSPYGEFNPNSTRHVRFLIYGLLGEEVKKFTKDHAPSTDKEVLVGLQEKYPNIIEPLLDFRTTSKFYSTYIKPIRGHLASDGRIHAWFSQTTARSGRSATEDPNMQNWPHLPDRIKKFPEKYHDVFAPRMIIIPDEGCVFLEGDYSQQELRIAAAVSKDPVMTHIFSDFERGDPRGDIHNATAKAIFGDVEITDEKRRAAKVVNFGIIYGVSAWGLSKELKEKGIDFSEEESGGFIRGFLRKYKGYANWTERVIEFVNKYHYVETPTGRIRNFPPPGAMPKDKDREALYREAINTPVQGPAYDFLAMALVRFMRAARKYKLKTYICNTIHDDNIFCGPPEELGTVIEIYTEIAQNPPDWIGGWLGTIPLFVDYKTGGRWSEMEKM